MEENYTEDTTVNDISTSEFCQSASQQQSEDSGIKVSGVGTWFGRLILMLIPVVNIVMLIIWCVSKKDKVRKNFAAAYLILSIILGVILSILGSWAAKNLEKYDDSEDYYDEYDYYADNESTEYYDGGYVDEEVIEACKSVTVDGENITICKDTIGDVLTRYGIDDIANVSVGSSISVEFYDENGTDIQLDADGSGCTLDNYTDAVITDVCVYCVDGTTLDFNGVTETSTTADIIELFGEPTGGYNDTSDYAYAYLEYTDENYNGYSISLSEDKITYVYIMDYSAAYDLGIEDADAYFEEEVTEGSDGEGLEIEEDVE